MLRNMYGFERLDNRVKMFMKVAKDNILPVRALNYLNTACLIFLCRNKSVHNNLVFERNRMVRNTMSLRSAAAKNSFGKKDIDHFGVNIYNNLPIQIRKSVHIHAFKYHVRRFISNDQFMSKYFNNSYLKSFG
ncbi:hypothetical protein ACKWTF_001658 [Chironomus riparius]